MESTSILEETPVIGENLEKRKEKLFGFLKKKKDWMFYILLAFITFVGVYIRTLNLSKLKDVTTGAWTLGPDLDPFLFLRWAKYIIENGSLMAHDAMRYVPLGYDTAGEMKLLAYMIAWLHKFLGFFSLTDGVTYSAILFPVIMFGLTAIVFFLFTKEIFYEDNKTTKNLIALIATALFVLVPSLLPRTIAGIPEKESAAFFFIFASFYFFIKSYRMEKFRNSIIFSILAGLTSGMLGLVWGGVGFVTMTISGAVLFSFILGKINGKKFYLFGIWILVWAITMMPFSTRYVLSNLIESVETGVAFVVFFILLIDYILIQKNVLKIREKINGIKIPQKITVLIISVLIVFILIFALMGPEFIIKKVESVIGETIHPLDVSRFGLTVAENKQPYFISDWKESFGPVVFNIPLYFWLFFMGSVVLFGVMIKNLRKKERVLLIFGYFIFLICLIFSKYDSHPNPLDGEGNLSLLVYFGGALIFLGIFVYTYFKRYKEKELSVFEGFNFSYVLYFVILTMTIIAARGAVRLILVLGAISPVAVSYLVVMSVKKYLKEKGEVMKLLLGIAAIIIIASFLFTLWVYYQSDKNTGENYAPGPYNWQWQKAMSWVRENTPKNAVFAHWWDYGYWVQTIGERATMLDGGNAITYWDYLMGRYVLTGINEKDALDVLYTHNVTHLLIDSTEIGKYSAFSSIGSNENYDRFSEIRILLMDEKQTQETKNETVFAYTGGIVNDEDILWKDDGGKEIFLPRRSAIIAGILLTKEASGKFLQPEAVFIYNNKNYRIPLKYAYFNDTLFEFDSGIDAGIFVFPEFMGVVNNQISINNIGALLYLSNRTINSNLVKLYLFGENSDSFKLVHTEVNPYIEDLEKNGVNPGDFIYLSGFQGPIKIWEIKYPEGSTINPEYLKTDYPSIDLEIANPGEY
jgi:asparagine N-glycosylation enzyme membrane subunit Stt3